FIAGSDGDRCVRYPSTGMDLPSGSAWRVSLSEHRKGPPENWWVVAESWVAIDIDPGSPFGRALLSGEVENEPMAATGDDWGIGWGFGWGCVRPGSGTPPTRPRRVRHGNGWDPGYEKRPKRVRGPL